MPKPNKLETAISKVKIPSIKPKVLKIAIMKDDMTTEKSKTEEPNTAESIISATEARMKLKEIEAPVKTLSEYSEPVVKPDEDEPSWKPIRYIVRYAEPLSIDDLMSAKTFSR